MSNKEFEVTVHDNKNIDVEIESDCDPLALNVNPTTVIKSGETVVGKTVADSYINENDNTVLKFDDDTELELATPKELYWSSTNW